MLETVYTSMCVYSSVIATHGTMPNSTISNTYWMVDCLLHASPEIPGVSTYTYTGFTVCSITPTYQPVLGVHVMGQ